MKTCIKCKVAQAFVYFDKQPGNKDGFNNSCKKCRKAYQAARKATNPKKFKDYKLQERYNITIAQYDQMYLAQSGCCAICHTGSNKSLHVDHCHKTGKVRGLLCLSCNRGIGFLKDSRELLKAADEYLTAFEGA